MQESKAYTVGSSPTKFGDSTSCLSCVIRPSYFFYKLAVYCRPEVAGDVISGQRASGVEVVPLTKFGDSTSSRSCAIRPSCFLQFYKMAAYCRPEVAGDVISGQRASGVEVVQLTKFGDPQYKTRQTDRRTIEHARKKSPSYALCIACTASVG